MTTDRQCSWGAFNAEGGHRKTELRQTALLADNQVHAASEFDVDVETGACRPLAGNAWLALSARRSQRHGATEISTSIGAARPA
jgi:hypothetical protein